MTDQTCLYETAKPESITDQLTELVRTVFVTLAARIRRGKLHRSTMRQLQALDDRQLADIGFTRADVESRYPTLISDMAGWPLR